MDEKYFTIVSVMPFLSSVLYMSHCYLVVTLIFSNLIRIGMVASISNGEWLETGP